MAIDTSAVLTPVQDRIGVNAGGPNPGDVIVTDNLWKTYEMGDQVGQRPPAASTSASATTSTSPSWAPPAPASPPS